MDKIEIPLSKTKITLAILGCVIFVVAGFWILLYIADHQTRFDPLLLKIVGIIAVIVFGGFGIFSIKKLFDNKVGLTIDNTGITDNSSGVSVGLIEWRDIKNIRTEQVMSTKFLLVEVLQPEKYLERGNSLQSKLMKGNLKMYGTPVAIASTTLQCNFAELESTLKTQFDKHLKSLPNTH